MIIPFPEKGGLLRGRLRFLLFFSCFLLSAGWTQAQWSTSPQNANNIFNTSMGSVGIQTQNPQALLDLGPGGGVKALFYGSGGSSGYYWGVGVNLGQIQNEASIFIGGAPGSCCGSESFAVVSADQNAWPYTSYTTRFSVNSVTGNVLIGKVTQANTSYRLDVSGAVRADKVVVNTTGADFVFDPGYRLSSLSEIGNFVKRYHHLPGIEPATIMQKNGVDLGEGQLRLLQKIEELTLYAIGQEKMLKEQEDKMKEQERILKAQEERIKRLEERMAKGMR